MRPTTPVVLLVENHEDSLEMYALGLRAMGFQPVTARTAADAFARACEINPDVVVSEVRLPGESGLELARRLREDARTQHIGIIVMTADDRMQAPTSDVVCDRCLFKPCLPNALAAEILDLLMTRRPATDVPEPPHTSARHA